MCSTDTYSSFIFLAIFSLSANTKSVSCDTYIPSFGLDPPVILGLLSTSLFTSFSKFSSFDVIFFISSFIKLLSCSSNASNMCSCSTCTF